MSDWARGGQRTLLTGGTGFLGINVADALMRTGREVLIVSRHRPLLPEHALHFAQADVLARAQIQRLFDDFAPTEVVHLAAKTDFLDREDPVGFEINTMGTRNVVLAAARSATTRRLIFASSHVVALPRVTDRAPQRDRIPRFYEESKLAGEQIVRACVDTPFAWCIVRPCSVWGPWFRRPFREFFLTIARGRYFHPGTADPPKRLAFVGNLCHQLLALLRAPEDKVHSRIFYLADYEATTLSTWANLIADRLGVPPARRMPETIVRLGAHAGDLLKSVGYRYPPLSSFRLTNMRADISEVPVDPIRQVAGPLPYSLEQGVDITVDWLRQSGLVKSG